MALNPEEPESEDLVEWLKDAGRRVPRRSLAIDLPPAPPSAASWPKPRSNRALLLSAFAALSYLPYFYADVYLEIARLPAVIVFVPVQQLS
jgi:hypothetical protein